MVNMTKLNKALGNKNNMLLWYKEDGYNYITNGYWIIKTRQEIKGAGFNKLVKELKGIPQEGEGYQTRAGSPTEFSIDFIKSLKNMLDISEDFIELEDTRLTHEDQKGYNARILKGNDYILVQEDYFNLVDRKASYKIIGQGGSFDHIHIINATAHIMLLPLRTDKNAKEFEYLDYSTFN